ncbi:uncharacterized protein PG986_014659 [Apiospora aurea]|uniref:DUF7923 domain-containing protein n=1 Tax=Apiospora aurea TaxID=335848 RepID=A0ABR1PTL2_9PEZI
MEAELKVFRGRFTTIQTGLVGEVDRGIKLIGARRRLQQEKKEWKAREERRPFVAALIDADADVYMFDEEMFKKGEKGGVEAADALLAAVQSYAKETLGFSAETNIVVKAFANMNGLREALQRRGTPCDMGQLRAFTSGFNNRQALFDFVDVGSGKERADSKIRENISFFVDSFQCKHLMLACGHDTGYAPFLGQFVANKQIADRITLIKGRSQLPAEIQKLGLKTTQFDGVFKGLAPMVTGTVWGRITAAAPKPAAHLAQDKRHSSDVQPGIAKTPSGYANPAAQSSRLGPVIRDQNGRRVDRALQVDQTAVERLRKGGCVTGSTSVGNVLRSAGATMCTARWRTMSLMRCGGWRGMRAVLRTGKRTGPVLTIVRMRNVCTGTKVSLDLFREGVWGWRASTNGRWRLGFHYPWVRGAPN